jgi:squalene synthase HpnC
MSTLDDADAATLNRPSVDEAFEYCARITKAHYENFPVASLFLPEEKRPYIQAIYAFSRIADDFADELVRPPAERLDDLLRWEEQLLQCYQGHAIHPVFIALRETVTNLGIPIEPLRDLLTAFKRDVVEHRYETFQDLLGYCRCSANPVGRLILMIFGCRDEALLTLSDEICTALQLANFWQDVAVDQEKDRLYIPLEDLRSHGYTLEEWKRRSLTGEFRALMKFEVDRTREMFYRGAGLPAAVEKELQLELKLVWFGGLAILRKIERNRFDVIRRRPSLSGWNKLMILVRGLTVENLARFERKGVEWDQD